MATPRKKISISKRKIKHWMWQRVNLKKLSNKYRTVKCSNCWWNKLPHRVCPNCWYYNWEQVLTIKVKKEANTIDV